jgi:hypothetical protein
MKTLKIIGTSFRRYNENGILRHSIELHLDGALPDFGLGLKEIAKLCKKSKKGRNYFIKKTNSSVKEKPE